MTRPFSPFQSVLYFWKCSTNRPVAVTLSPFTMTPFVPVLVFHRSVSPFTPAVKPSRPWSARHTHVWSMSTLSALTSSAVVALPMCGPPTRKYTSLSVMGFAASALFPWPLPPALPTRMSTGESVVPASMVIPAMTMPAASFDLDRNSAAHRRERRVPEAEHDGVGALRPRSCGRRRRRPASGAGACRARDWC